MTLEHLEAAFYEEGLKNYTQADFVNAGLKDPFYANLQEVGKDEQSHEAFLTSALKGMFYELDGDGLTLSTFTHQYLAAGASPVARCNYSFPATDAKSFASLASVLEGKFIFPFSSDT